MYQFNIKKYVTLRNKQCFELKIWLMVVDGIINDCLLSILHDKYDSRTLKVKNLTKNQLD